MPNIFKRAFNYFNNRQRTTVVSDRHQYLNSKTTSALTGGRFDFTQPYISSTVFSCVQLITNNISKLRLNVYRNTDRGREIYHEHRWQKALAYSPDGRLSTGKWLNYSTNNLLLDGGVYHLISEYDENLNPKPELKALPELETAVRYENEVWYKFKQVSNWIPSRHLIFPYMFSPDGVTPISPISAIKTELEIQFGAEQTVKNFYQNNTFSILYMEADLEGLGLADKQKVQEYFERVENEVAGSANAFTNGGIIKVPPMFKLRSLPIPDLKYLENSKFTEGRIAAIFNVPPHLLNIEGSAPVGKIEVNQLNFLNNCLAPILSIYENELNHKLLTIEEREQGIEIAFDIDNLFTLDLETKTLYLKNLSSTGAISPNEIRKKLGMAKVENEFMDMNWIQSQNQPIQNYGNWQKQLAPAQANNNTQE